VRNRSFSMTASLVALATLLSASAYATHAQYYVLDGFGGVHAGGGAGIVSPATPYFGFDIARDLAYVPGSSGDGLLVLDGFGGVHLGGAVVGVFPATPYFGFDIARAIVYRNVPPRINGSIDGSTINVASGSYVSLNSTSITAPDDGFLLVIGTTEMFCSSVLAGSSIGTINFDVDALAGDADLDYPLVVPDCTAGVGFFLFEHVATVSGVVAVTAGSHTVHLLGRDSGGTHDPTFGDRTISAIFIDHGLFGDSIKVGVGPTNDDLAGVRR